MLSFEDKIFIKNLWECKRFSARRLLREYGQDVAQQLVSAFILVRLDNCNSLLPPLQGQQSSLCSVW